MGSVKRKKGLPKRKDVSRCILKRVIPGRKIFEGSKRESRINVESVRAVESFNDTVSLRTTLGFWSGLLTTGACTAVSAIVVTLLS